jgi:hypothetical protein
MVRLAADDGTRAYLEGRVTMEDQNRSSPVHQALLARPE